MADTDFNVSAQIAAAVASVYANPAATVTKIAEIELHNTNATAETVELSIVPNSSGSVGTYAAANKKHKFILAADETVFVPLKFPYILTDTNDTLQAVTTTASKVNITIKGVKST